MKMRFDSTADYIVDGTAIDQETIIRLRPKIEEEINKYAVEPYDHTKLFWEMEMDEEKNMTFYYELHFFKEPEPVAAVG